MFCARVAWVCLVCLLLCKEEGSSPVSAISERRDMGLYEVPLSVSLLGFGIGTMLANFHKCGIMLVFRAVFNMLVRNASPTGPMCFRCLMFSLSGPCEFFSLFYCLLDLRCGECDAISLYFMCCSVNGSVCLVFFTVFVNCLVKQFTICLGVFAIWFLNVMGVFSVGGGALLDRLCMVFQRMCVVCL